MPRRRYHRASQPAPRGDSAEGEEIRGRPPVVVPRDSRGRWLPGTSANPYGRTARSKVNQLSDSLFSEAAPDIIRTVIERAKQGDSVCLQLAMSRISPAIRGTTMALPGLPPLDTVENCDTALGAVTEAGAVGRITTEEASLLVTWIKTKQESLGARQLAERLRQLEARPVDLEGEILRDVGAAA